MSEQPIVAVYVVRRLAREGITDCFGVAGDFAFKLCDAVARSEAVRRVGCVYNDLAPWNYHTLPAALGCRGRFTAKLATLGELDAALARASTGESACNIEGGGGRMDFPPVRALAHQHLDAMYAND